jgi:hypothetical protein
MGVWRVGGAAAVRRGVSRSVTPDPVGWPATLFVTLGVTSAAEAMIENSHRYP